MISFKSFKPFKKFKSSEPPERFERLELFERFERERERSLIRRRPEHAIGGQFNIQSLPTIAHVAADHKVSRAARTGGVAAGDVAEAREYCLMICRMMHQGPNH